MRIYFFICVFFAAVVLHAQPYSLSFESVQHFSVTANPTGSSGVIGTSSFTIPAAKVFKVESLGLSGHYVPSGMVYPLYVSLSLDNVLLFYYNPSSNFRYEMSMPMWLPSGTYTLKLCDYSGYNPSYQFKGVLSGIMFQLSTP